MTRLYLVGAADRMADMEAVPGSVVVVGSVNVDSVVSVDRFPTPGETLMARQVSTHLGGKGLSQAIAAARFGSACSLIATVGDDADGAAALRGLAAAGVDCGRVRTSSLPTGRAFVWVDREAENMIAVVAGANLELTALSQDDVDLIGRSSVVLTQFEAGTDIAVAAVLAGRAAGALVVLNAAPALPIEREVLAAVDLLVVNEVEVLQFASSPDLDTAAAELAQLCGAVLVTLGARGGRLYRALQPALDIEAPAVAAIDTTGAGDVSCGVIAAALAQGESLPTAIRVAFAAGALAVQVEGNASAIPTRAQVLDFAPLRPTA